MNILITNDDGILAPALPHFARWAQQYGNVTVIAPKVEQSGMSHAIVFTRPIEIKPVDIGEGIEAYSLDSTPADCVRYAVTSFGKAFDVVFSGVNRGLNLGKDIVYSGTVGAIFEAARLGLHGFAFSADPSAVVESIAHLDRVMAFMQKHQLAEKNRLYNINIPPQGGEIRITRQGGIFFTDVFVHRGNFLYEQEGEIQPGDGSDPEQDIDAIYNGLISITPLAVSLTDMTLFEQLKTAEE